MLRTVILVAIFITVKGDECVQRQLPSGIVCVCNSTYCDTIDEPDVQANQFLLYTSTKDGQRLRLTVNNFSNQENITEPGDDFRLLLTVDASEREQAIHGFGGAMTDAAALNIRTLSNATQNKLFESYFGNNGIGYTYCRIPIAGTDFSTRPYTYDDMPGDLALSNFKLVDEDNYKIGYLNHIKSIMHNSSSLRIFTTAWTAPAWMKSTNNIQWGVLKPEFYQLYAEYIKKFFDAYKERGINIWGMTPGNEPLDGAIPNFPFNAMLWTPSKAADWSVNNLAPTLNKAGYNNVVYMAMDDQRFELPRYPEFMFENEQAKKLFTGIAYHWYTDDIFSPMRLTLTHKKFPDKFLLMSEACTGSSPTEFPKVILGSWNRGERYVSDIIENLSHWVSGWIDWNIALNEIGGPNWAKNFVDSPIIVMPQKDEFYKQPMFYGISHFSKFVPRDSFKISLTGLENNKDVQAVAFLTPEGRIIIVAINKCTNPVAIKIRDKNTNNTMNLILAAKSFNTLLYLEQQ